MTQNEHAIPYQNTPLVIDGQANDWKDVLFTLDPGTTLRYAITNDTGNLYLCLTTNNPGLENKMFRMGLKVYFDTSGGRQEATGIQFPLPVDDNALKAIAQAGGSDPRKALDQYRRFIRLQENQYETFGFPGGGNGLNAMGSQDYVNIGFSLGPDDIFIYELKIPLKALYGEPLPPTVFTRPFSIGLYIDGVPRSEDPNAPVASEIGMPGSNMTGARINVGQGKFMTDPYHYSSETLYKPQRAWIKFNLAKP